MILAGWMAVLLSLATLLLVLAAWGPEAGVIVLTAEMAALGFAPEKGKRANLPRV